MKLTEGLRELLGDPTDLAHLAEALTHPSYSNEQRASVLMASQNGPGRNYQRLEFLGDAVLQLCVSERLVAQFEDAREGQLSFLRASIVSTEALASFALSIDLGPNLLMGRGADASNERDQVSVLADGVEAVLGAVYLDRGIDAARALAARVVDAGLADQPRAFMRDPKSELQERIQAVTGEPPRYQLVSSDGPDHAREFEIEVSGLGRSLGRGRGRSKKLAEHAAAKVALETLASEANASA